ncbi:hypothetical protein Mgra_00005630 [Meloidogyne graminicola]|uniref:CCHC-type domain-containing protein n=1 Tax=Meloidogyne graminicola TaxID=189291 RepID=A0A8S9ZP92_9BILA|nr:hypothetical protein Mgra_00005630 [Meloidogyne graminicola]
MKCYNCNNFGHMARYCPDKRPPSSLGSSASQVDRTLVPVKLNMGVSSLDGQNIPATPQVLLDAAVYRYNRKEGLLSSENSWLCASLMLKNFMYQYNFDTKSHRIKSAIEEYLVFSLADRKFAQRLDDSWDILERSHQNSYDDRCSLYRVNKFLITAAEFCNCLYKIYSEQLFKPNDFLQWLSDDLAYEIAQRRDGRWKRVSEWREIDRKKNWNSSN